MKKHLAVFKKSSIEQILKGEKTIETRFSKKRISPFEKVMVGDIVYMKLSGKDIKGQFIVKKVISFEGLDQKDFQFIKQFYGEKISSGDKTWDRDYFKSKESSKYGTLIFIGDIEQFITSPINYTKKDQRGWVVLD